LFHPLFQEQLQLAALNLEEELNMSIADAQGEKGQCCGLGSNSRAVLMDAMSGLGHLLIRKSPTDSAKSEKSVIERESRAGKCQRYPAKVSLFPSFSFNGGLPTFCAAAKVKREVLFFSAKRRLIETRRLLSRRAAA